MRTLRIRGIARREYIRSIEWYDAQQPGLGSSFSRAVEVTIDELLNGPERWPEIRLGVRQAPVPDWPFTILYRIHPRTIGVIAVFHTSRDPQEWMDRI